MNTKMSVPVYLYPPEELANRNIVDCFKTEEWPIKDTNKVVLDFRKVKFIAPWAVCLYGAYACWMREKYQCQIQIKGNPTTRTGSYIARSGLPNLVGASFTATDSIVEPKIFPLSKITKSKDIQPLVNGVRKLLCIDDQEMEGATQYSITELVRNAVQHSQSTSGGMVMAQFYPQPGEVDVIVADMGVGIRKTLGVDENIETDAQALTQAIRPHISGTFKPTAYASMKDNAGLGLFITSEIATMSNGSFLLGSGDTLLEVGEDELGKPKKNLHQTKTGGWPGTFAMLQLRRDGIGDFDDLLETCRDTAEKIRTNPLEFPLNFISNISELNNAINLPVREFEEDVEAAAQIRDETITPALNRGKSVVLDFSEVRFATQSFVHALFYKLFRDFDEVVVSHLFLVKCSKSTRKAIEFVAGYAKSVASRG